VRLMRRADGYYAQFAADVQRRVEHVPTGLVVAVDGWIRI
jgi:putative transposase